MIVKLGNYNVIRLYDIVSIIAFSIFANKLCNISGCIKLADVFVLVSSLLAGISLSIIFSTYVECHKQTDSDMNKDSYSQYFSDEVNNRKNGLRLLWIIVLVAIICFALFWLCLTSILPNTDVICLPIQNSPENAEWNLMLNHDSICMPNY